MMSPGRKKRGPEEVWRSVEAQGAAEEAARVRGLSEREVDAELAAGGFDPAAERAKGAAFAAALLARRLSAAGSERGHR